MENRMSTTAAAVTPKGHELVNGSASVQTHHVAGQVMAALMAHAERRTSLWVATGHVPVAELFRRPGEPVAPAAAPVT